MGFIPMKLICFSAIVSLFYLLFFNYFLSPAQTDATLLLANNYQHCWMLHVASVCTPCCMLLDVVACRCAKFETSKTFQPKLPTFLLFRDRRSEVQQCWIRFCSSSNIVGTTHAHRTWSPCILPTMPCRSQHSPIMLGVAASVCTPLC